MGAITFKCPNCGGELIFDPASQQYLCEYCGSKYTQQQLDALQPSEGSTYTAEEDSSTEAEEYVQEKSGKTTGRTGKDGEQEEAVIYSCPSCGAEIVTTETTAATFCYYCHNPVVLKGQLSGEYLPDSVIPFKIDKKQAVEKFQEFIKKKKYVPKAFSTDSQIEKMTGVYYPYWLYESDVEAELEGSASIVHVKRRGDEEITERNLYHVRREGQISYTGMTRNALQSDHREMVENVQPYNLNDRKQFSMGFLSGFQAERRDMEKKQFSEELRSEVQQYSEKLMLETVSGYTSIDSHQTNVEPVKEKWLYCLLPAWILTYRTTDGKTYYFALNGQTGAVAGKLPIDKAKLALHAAITGGVAAAVTAAIMYFLV